MKCFKCGAEGLDENSRFCPECGALIEQPAEEIPEVIEESAETAETTEIIETADEITEKIEEAAEGSPILPEIGGVEEIAEEIPEKSEEEPAEEIPEEIKEEPLDEPADPFSSIFGSEPVIEPAPEIEDAPAIEPVSDSSITGSLFDEPLRSDSSEFAPHPEPAPYSDPEPYSEPFTAPYSQDDLPEYVGDPDNAPFEGAPQEEPAEPAPVKVGVFRLMCSHIISVIAAVILLAVCVMFSAKLGLDGDNLRRQVMHMNKYTLIGAQVEDKTAGAQIYKVAGISKATHNFADEEEFSMFLMQTDYRRFLGDKVKSYVNYIIDGKGKEPTLTADEIVDFFMEHHDLAEDMMGYKLQQADYNAIRTSLEENEVLGPFTINSLSKTVKFRLENTSYIFSYLTIGIFFTLAVVLMIWIAVITDKRAKYLMGFYGNIFCWSGSLTFIVGLALTVGTTIMAAITNELVFHLGSVLFMPMGAIALCTGGALLIIGGIMRKAKRGIRRKEKAAKINA